MSRVWAVLKAMNNQRSANPLYVAIARQLRDEIETRYVPGDYLPSERELHRRFGVTVKTIRSALATLAEEGIVQKLPSRGTVVLQKPLLRLPTVPVSASLGLAAPMSRGDSVALVMPLAAFLLASLARGVEPALRRHAFRLVLCGTYPDAGDADLPTDPEAYEGTILESLVDEKIAGVLWWSAFGPKNRPAARRLLAHGTPVVLLDNPVPHLACDWVGIDDYSAAYQACQHLISLGHRDIAFLGQCLGDYIPSAYEERLAGYADALLERQTDLPPVATYPAAVSGLTLPDLDRVVPAALRDRVRFLSPHASAKDEGLISLLTSDPVPTALYLATDHLAAIVVEALGALGLRIPEDVALVTMGDIGRFVGESSTLTAIRQPFELMAKRAVRLLIQRMREPDRPIQHVNLPTRLIVRRSTIGDAELAAVATAADLAPMTP